MARQNIQFKGMRHSPSDITGQDGDLLECVNLIHENGELKPIEMPERSNIRGVYRDPKTGYSYQGTLAAVHNLTDGKKFVFVRTLSNGTSTISNLFVNIEGSNESIYEHTIMGEILWVETIGNTLIVGTDRSTHYVLYKNGQYKWLGDKLPQPVFEFDFQRDSSTHDGASPSDGNNGYYVCEYDPNIFCIMPNGNTFAGGGIPLVTNIESSYEYPSINHPERSMSLASTQIENKKIFRDGIVARHTQVMSTTKHANVFVYPFLIRYAVRMYDGNYAMHSAPILMIPSSLVNPILSVIRLKTSNGVHLVHEESGIYSFSFDSMHFRGMNLKYQFKGFIDAEGNPIPADDWEDIIKGVDLFMSSQIQSFDERAWDDLNQVPTKFYCFNKKISDGNGGYIDAPNWKDYGCCYSQNKRIEWWRVFEDGGVINPNETFSDWQGDGTPASGSTGSPNIHYVYYKIPLPQRSPHTIMEEIKNTNLFYRVKKYDLIELKTAAWNGYRRFSSEADSGILTRLETLPTLPDDYISRCRMTGKVNYNYNQRLVLGNIKLQAPLWYQDAKQFENSNYDAWLMFKIEKPEKTIWVRWEWERLGQHDFGHYLYFPDPDCKEVVLCVRGETWHSIPMHEHTGLNGAYALMPDLQSLYEARQTFEHPQYSSLPGESTDRYYQMPNTIAMSSVANPFHFPASNFKDIGRTKVVGIAANTLDVSSGQWGQYPLYVFCSDGIIAVMIDGEGKFGGIQAVSADVLREPRGLSRPTLVQTGQALMFLTQRGVMTIAGTQINCLSEAMNGRHFNPMRELADVDYHIGAFANLIGRTSDDTDFRDFAASGFLAYDYAHHRVLLLRSDRDYQYVYSLNTGFWSKQIIYTNLDSFQVEVVPGNELPAQRSSGVPLLKVKPIRAAVNNYTEMYLQDEDGWLYKTMEVQGQNSVKQLYQYGYLVSRPIRFGTDEYKTLTRVLHRYTNYASMSFVKMALYGSRDGVKYGRINTLRGMSYQYFIFVVYTYLKPNERYSYLTVDFETRLTNKLR